MSRYVDMAVKPTADGLRDEGPHRAAHAPVYRAYVRTDRDPYYQPGEDAEDRHALLRGLFITGFLAEDFFADHDYFGAARVLVLSASSKTALGFAYCADARTGIEVIGVTSPANHAFTHAIGCYDEVVCYEDIESVPSLAPIVSIDMSGNGAVLARVHAHFGDQLRHSMAIGRSHHDAPPRAEGLPGPRPAFFFAPTQVKKRLQDWGPRGYQERTASCAAAIRRGEPPLADGGPLERRRRSGLDLARGARRPRPAQHGTRRLDVGLGSDGSDHRHPGFHHEADLPRQRDVRERIAGHRDDVGVESRLQLAEIVHTKHLGRVERR